MRLDRDAEFGLLRKFVDTSSAMMAYWDAEARCVFANRAYERWFGVSPEWMIGRHISELLGPLYAKNLPHIEGALRGEPQEFERTFPDPRGGQPRYTLANYVPDVVDGVVKGFFALVSEVSEIKRTQIALQESEERFRLTIDEAPVGMALVAPDGRFIRVNRALCDIVGYCNEELVGLTFQTITHPDDRDADTALLGQLVRGDIQRYQRAKRYIRKDGAVVDIMLRGSVLRRADGSVIHFISQIEDVTAQKRADAQQRFLARIGPVLAESLDYEETLRRVGDFVVDELADMCIIECVADDDEVRRLTVATHDPRMAWIAEALMTIPLDHGRRYLLHPVLTSRKPFVLEQPTRETIESLAQGEEHAAVLRAAQIHSLIAVPVLDGDRLLAMIGLISSSPTRVLDLTLAQELAARAALSIRSAQLYAAAQRATRARDDILGIVAHDLRNPLSSILLRANGLGSGHTDAAQCRRTGALIERAAQRMNRLIEDLLDVVRMEAGKLSVHTETVDVLPLMTELLETQRLLARDAGIELVAELPPKLPAVVADCDRLTQVFENLIGNALKFTPSGGTIALAAEACDGEVLFHVRDTGCGIAPDSLPHLFDRFWQGQKGARHGAGLGLPIVKGIIEAHGGRIWVDSVQGMGTTVHFSLRNAASSTERTHGASARRPAHDR